jgi:hypothetical protein
MVELLLVMTAGMDRREFKLLPGGPPVIVGRGADANFKIEAPLLSRRHFEVRFDEHNGLEISDLKSANGTFVNGLPAQKAPLRPGDVIRAGDIEIRVDFEGGPEPSPSSGAWIADAVSGDIRCHRCGRLISTTTVGDDQSFEWSDELLCPSCKDGSAIGLSGAFAELTQPLHDEGYEVLAKLSGDGTLAPVFKARRLGGAGELVAVKTLALVKGLSEKKIERFKTEARAMARVEHPNVVRVHEVKQRPGLAFMVMEFVDGETLLKKIEREGKLHVLEALRVGLAISRALEAATRQGIVHRNVKPGNIIVAEDGTPKLVDFGLAKGVRAFSPEITDEEETLGTIRYMAPEQVKDARAADARSDVYALAATIFHALTGKLPYPNRSDLDLLKHVIAGSLPEFIIAPIETIPPQVAQVLIQALREKPEDRHATSTKFREALAEAIFSVSGGRVLLSAEDLDAIPASANQSEPGRGS